MWIIWTVMLMILSVVRSESEPITKCDILFNAAISARNNILKNPVIAEIYDKRNMIGLQEMAKDYLGLSSIDDDNGIRQIACKIADIKSMSELAAMFDDTTQTMRENLQYLKAEAESHDIESYSVEVRKLHRWIKKSGFPDNWPLNTDMDETKKLLKSSPTFLDLAIKLYGGSGKSPNEIAKILTGSTSLESYLKAMDVEYLLEHPENLRIELAKPRALKNKKKMLSILNAMDSYINIFLSVVEVRLADLP